MASSLDPPAIRPGPLRRIIDEVLSRRDRLLASESFRRRATAFALTRPVARRRSRDLFDLCAGFVYSQVLYACIELKLFEQLERGPLALHELATRLDLPEERAHRLLEAAVSLDLVSRRGRGRYGLARLGAALIGNSGVQDMIRHHRMLYGDLADPVALLRAQEPDTELRRYWAYARNRAPETLKPDSTQAYTRLMAASQAMVAEQVLEAYPLHRHRCLLDIGGGDGSFLMAAAERAPHLRLMLFDLPPVAASAEARFRATALDDRATAYGGDFFANPLPQGADIVSLVRVVHDHDDAAALTLLRRAREALCAGGTLLLAEPMAGTDGAAPAGAAYFGFYLLAMGQGRPRRRHELDGLLRRAGFRAMREIGTRNPLVARLLVARA